MVDFMLNEQYELEIFEMLEEIFNNYLVYFEVKGIKAYQPSYSNQEKDKVVAEMELSRDQISVFANLKGSVFENLLFELLSIFENYKHKSAQENNTVFKQFMRSYELTGIDCAAIYNPKIKKKVRGIRNMRIRYEKDVYPKLEIFYDLLKEKVEIQGKWSSVNVAVRDILPALKNKFLEYDHQKIINKIEENKIYIEENKKLLMNGTDTDFKYYKRHHVQKWQSELVEENRQLEQMLQSNDLSYALKKKSPFNTEYLDEVLMNNLRKNKELMNLVIINH